jgi:hypothetical protein
MTIYPNWSEAERRDSLCVGQSRFAVASTRCRACADSTHAVSLEASLTDAMGLLQHDGLLDYQTVLLAFNCETDTRHAATLDTELAVTQMGVSHT